jgi:hypothetical protein
MATESEAREEVVATVVAHTVPVRRTNATGDHAERTLRRSR